MGVFVNLPTSVKYFIEQSLTDMLDLDVFGKNCVLYMPPLPVECVNCVPDPIGMKSSNTYIHGGPMPFEDGQICPMCHGDYLIQEQVTSTIVMTIEYKLENFLQAFKKTIRSPENSIQTRGFTTDISKVLNCTHMEIKQSVGATHYRYKLAGEPIIAGHFTDKFFYSAWERI